MSTNALKASEIKRSWHLIDARGQILGRISTKIATLLMGKGKPYFVPFLDCGDYVVVVNAKDVVLTGKKETQKLYTRHSGFSGGLRQEVLSTLKERKPEQIIIHAVKGMLPKNKLGSKMITRLHVYANSEHPYKENIKHE